MREKRDLNLNSEKDIFCEFGAPESNALIIFGATGDLSRKKLIPTLLSLFRKRRLPSQFFLLGCAVNPYNDDTFREEVKKAVKNHFPDLSLKEIHPFLQNCCYLSLDFREGQAYELLAKRLKELEEKYKTQGNRLFYLATLPSLYPIIVKNLTHQKLIHETKSDSPWTRLVIEKPFGVDLKSAVSLNRELHKNLSEKQIYRIDHYLGKETVQNILIFRFANSVFEPIWNRNYIDHVQITVAESIGVGERAQYFEQTGELRDMLQSHLFQLLALVAIEPPGLFDAERIRNEKVKLLKAVKSFPYEEIDKWVVRAQYEEGEIAGKKASSYREEPGVSPNSTVETFVALKLLIDNWRWHGVPFYLRTGKRLKRKATEISIFFKNIPHSMFPSLPPEDFTPNILTLNIQPKEGVSLLIQVKEPVAKICLKSISMHFFYDEFSSVELPEAYERLLLDVMLGDQTLFWRYDGVETSWSILEPILRAWKEKPACKLVFYPSGSWGPKEADKLIERDGRKWREL